MMMIVIIVSEFVNIGSINVTASFNIGESEGEVPPTLMKLCMGSALPEESTNTEENYHSNCCLKTRL
jgi:hypothetical protein